MEPRLKSECKECGHWTSFQTHLRYSCYEGRCPALKRYLEKKQRKRLESEILNKIHLFLDDRESTLPDLAKTLSENIKEKIHCIAFLQTKTGGSRENVVKAIDTWIEENKP